MKVLYLCGAGNPEGVRLALRINRRRPRWDRIVLLDDDAAKHGRSILGVKIVGPFSMLSEANRGTSEVANLVARTTKKRWSAREKIASYGVPFASLLDPDLDLSGAELGQDITVYHNATVGPEVTIDEGSVVFMGAIVGHGSRMGRCCVVAPNGVVNARVTVGEGVYVGTNSAILPDLTIGAWSTIAACAMVLKDVPEGASVISPLSKTLVLGGARPRPRDRSENPESPARLVSSG